MNLCETCKFRIDELCTNKKLTEDYGGYKENEKLDMLIYPYIEEGYFWVGPKFGCVHHESSGVIKMKKYFSHHPSDGICYHDTSQEAMNAAEKWLDLEREEAYEGWSDDVEGICWGELKQITVKLFCIPKTDDDPISGDCDFFADYGLIDI